MSQYNDASMYSATFEAQFIEKLSNTETELKKSVAYKKACRNGTLVGNGLVFRQRLNDPGTQTL